MGYCVAPTGLGNGWWCDPQDLRPGLASVAPTGLLDRGCWGSGSALRWVVVGGWLVRGGILRVAQNDKGDGGGGWGMEGGGWLVRGEILSDAKSDNGDWGGWEHRERDSSPFWT